MKEITIAEQPWLSLKRTVKITVDGIRYRLFRATVTVAVIVVAVAFLMNILAESLIKRAVAATTRQRSEREMLNSSWSTRLTAPGSPESILEELARNPTDADICRETQAFLGADDPSFRDLKRQAEDAQAVLDFFQGLDYAKRRDLIKTAGGLAILDHLAESHNLEAFQRGLRRYRMIRFDMSPQKLRQIISRRKDLNTAIRAVMAERAVAIGEVGQYLLKAYPGHANDSQRLNAAMADATGDFGDTIRKAGFVFNPETVAPEVARQARNLQFTMRLKDSLSQTPKTRQIIAQKANLIPADINEAIMWQYLGTPDFARDYLDVMRECHLKMEGLTPELLVALASARKENAAIARARLLTMDSGRGFMGLGERLAYLLVVSFLVCGIGITNAMMMSVTERFTEIATLKCLGALDGFILLMFVLESCIMGVIGASIGAVIGAVIGTGRMIASFGLNFLPAIPVADILGGILVSILLGTVLAAVAAVIPSFKAARLAPMEAMRVE